MDDRITLDLSLLFSELGLDNISPEEKQKIAEMLHANVIAKIKVYLLENLPQEDLTYLDSIADDETKMVDFLVNKKEINFTELVLAVSQECREDFIRDANYAQGMLDATIKQKEGS